MDNAMDNAMDNRMEDGKGCALAARLAVQLRGGLKLALREYAQAVAAERVTEYRGQLRELDQIMAILRLRRAHPAIEYAAAAARAASPDWTYTALHDESVACEELLRSLQLQDPDACCGAWDARGCPELRVCERGAAALQALQLRVELAISAAVDHVWEGGEA